MDGPREGGTERNKSATEGDILCDISLSLFFFHLFVLVGG